MVKDDLRSIGHSGEAGRGNRSTSPSSAARSLAGPAKAKPAAKKSAPATPVADAPAKPAAKKATSAKAAPAKKAAAAKKTTPAKKATPAKKSAGGSKDAPTSTGSAPKKPAASASKPTAKSEDSKRRAHLRAVPDEPAAGDSASAPASEKLNKAKEKVPAPDPHPLSFDEVLTSIIEAAQRIFGADWERQLATIVAAVRRRMTGEYQIDEFGLDPQFHEIVTALLEPLAEKWFRLEVRGVENIPADGGALLVGNHSGTVPVDGMITMYAVKKYTGRHMRALGADLVFQLPIVGEVARKTGATVACAEDAERLLTGGELAAVWPEGFKGVGKSFSERYKLQRFGRGGFVSSAMRAQVPIIPVSIVGAEEIYPLVGNIPSLARLFGLPYIPITPFFPLFGLAGLIPLPSKWIIEFGEPIRTDAYAPESADDPMLLFNVTDQVRETIQQSLYRLLTERGNPFI
jgi:1-acyl-sn-glycerol-3-phosphate acyltransferase